MIALRKQINDALVSMSPNAQQQFLARLLVELTLIGRSAYDLSNRNSSLALLKQTNEFQNRISSQLCGLLFESSERYPDKVFSNIIVDNFVNLGIDEDRAEDLVLKCMRGIIRLS